MPALGQDDDSPTAIPASPEEISQALEEAILGKRIHDNIDDLIGYCSECKNVQSDQYYGNSIFYQQGVNVPCQYCGGVTMIIHERTLHADQAAFNAGLDRSRGFGSTKQVNPG